MKINFGVSRNQYFKILLENNQLFLKLLFIILVLILFNREIFSCFKNIKFKAIFTYSLIPAIMLILGNSLLIFLLFDSVSTINFSFSKLFIINSLVIGPIYEEFIYRFIFINNNWHFKTKLSMIIISTLIFMFSHRFAIEGNVAMLIQFLILGIYLGILYIKTNNILYCICTHLFYNGFILFFLSIL